MPSAAPTLDRLDAEGLLRALKTVRKGNFTTRVPLRGSGIAAEIAEALNDIIETN